MLKKKMVRICMLSILAFSIPIMVFAETVGLFYDSNVPQISFAAADVKTALEAKGFSVEMLPLTALKKKYTNKKVVIALASNSAVIKVLTKEKGVAPSGLGEQAYSMHTTTALQKSYWVLGGDDNGAMYGAIQIAENITAKGYSETYNTKESPFLLNRGMKLNMPLDRRIPTYVGGWSSTSTKMAIPHVWDMIFWKKLIDQQARFRYNVLSVWVHHPFPALVKLDDYPKASLPNIEGFDGFVKELNHEQRVAFWREVMQYAHSRGMKFYFFNWNIYPDYAQDQYPEIDRDQDNPKTIDYMYKSVKALIATYPELDGFGVSAGDGMEHTEGNQAMEWTWNAIGKAVNDYLAENPSRKFNLIHRSIYSNPEGWNKIYAPLKENPNATINYSVKYAQAHMYSTPTPMWTNNVAEVAGLGMKTWLTIRNDDYFYINWGDPQFVRDYMAGIPEKQAVTGMYIGSDGYTPSRTYFCKNPAMNGQLEVERRWYMEMLWGRISYNPQTSDEVFKNMLAKRFPTVSAENLFQAWTLASRPLPRATELIMEKWSLDFQWYPEGCLSEHSGNSSRGGTGFRTIDAFANLTTVAKGSNLCDIPTSAADKCGTKKSSYTVADEMQADGEKALELINTINSGGNADLEAAINNVKQMAYLSLYYAHKVRAATLKKAGKTQEAKSEIAKAFCFWKSYTQAMEVDYYGDSFRNMKIKPDWKFADYAVLREYTDLGGIGAPICGDKSYEVKLSSNDETKGTVEGSGPYNPGDNLIVVAIPKKGYRFLYWKENDLVISSDLKYKFTVNSEKALKAYFVESEGCAFPWNDPGVSVDQKNPKNSFGPVDISCAANGVSILMDIVGVGTDNTDYCSVYYKVDGAEPKLMAVAKGAFGATKYSVPDIRGKKLEILIEATVSFSGETYTITNLSVSDSQPAVDSAK